MNFSLSRLTEQAIWPGGKRLQTSGGETAGRNGWYFYILSETNYEPSNMFMEGLYLFLETSKKRSFCVFHHSIFTGRAVVAASMVPSFLPPRLLRGAHPWWPELAEVESDCLCLSGIFSQLLSRLNYDEEEMMANMGGYRLYRWVSTTKLQPGPIFESLWEQKWYFVKISFSVAILCVAKGARGRGLGARLARWWNKSLTGILAVFGMVFWYLGWCNWYSLINTTLHNT